MTALGAADAIAYFLAARLGLALISASSDLVAFWPASGVAAGILIALGRRALPTAVIGVVVGTVAANLMSNRRLVTCLLNGSWNAGEAVLAALVLARWFGRPFSFADLRRVAGFLAAASFATAASAISGAATMFLVHAQAAAPYSDVWRAWFLSDLVGFVVRAALVGLAQVWRMPPPRKEWIERVGVLGLTSLACSYTMTQKTGSWLSFSPSAFVLPLLLWLAARCQTAFGIAGAFLASGAILRGIITVTSIDQAKGRFPWE
jgi:integral membrane sensor domain MASE1